MKRSEIFFLTCVLAFGLCGCFADKGNYDYEDPSAVAPQILSQLEENYDKISLEILDIDPKLKEDHDAMEYLWMIYIVTNTNLPVDTIGRERKLDWVVNAQPGRYKLIFKATDTRNGTAAFQEASLSVSSPFGLGYFILKYENGRSDVDFVDRDGKVNPAILKLMTGEDMEGRPIRQAYSQGRYCYKEEDAYGEPQQYTWQSAYMICTDQDVRIFHGDDLHVIKTWDNAFIDQPAVKKPQGIWPGSSGYLLMNDNQLYSTYAFNVSDGCFGAQFFVPDTHLNPQVGFATSSYLVFDDIEGTYLGFSGVTGTVIRNVYADSPFPNVTGYDLEWMWAQPASTSSTFTHSIVKNRTDGSKMIVVHQTGNVGNFGHLFLYNYPLREELAIINGKIFAIQGSTDARGAIYFTTDGTTVGYYDPYADVEYPSILSVPAGEEIVQLQHLYFNAPTRPDLYENQYAILTKSSGGWKLYLHEMEGDTPEIKPTPAKTYSGTGEPAHVMYRMAYTSSTI